jgi:hypothetical protein
MVKTRKNLWSINKPGTHQKTVMFKKCGKKCFLGPNKSFPICKKNTCKQSLSGVHAAYVRARQYHYTKIGKRAKRLLNKK